ncbi:hypothetical protein M0R45_013202 [Rubus argutus]|uniref:DUF1771 domain-containing protein n=1 Tax=Rubus argutus TaxID=59490 RepID=A0AAW1XJD0_RUBAR
MEASGFNGALKFDEEQALRVLLDAFGQAFSIEEIASAYCKAGKNAEAAAETLALSTTEAKPSGEESSGGSDDGDIKSIQANGNGNSRASKTKYRPVSVGSVSSVIGKHYVNKTTSANGSYNGGVKPLKVDSKSKVLPIPESWVEKAESCSSGDNLLHQDMEDFLFTMLGEGFKLERDVIRDVLDSCGYDMEKSMENLINLSTSASDERNEVISNSNDKSAGSCLKSEVSSQGKYINSTEGNGDRASNMKGVESNGKEKERLDLQKEVLAALFNAPERFEEPELPRRIVRSTKGYGAHGHLVLQPPNDSFSECKTPVVYQQHHTEDDADDEDSYQVLRKNVKEYRNTMKEYYQAAVDAFSKGDRDRADKLLEEGHFFQKKARESDEESNKMILKPRNAETQGDIVLDLHEGGAKEAIRLLKCQLDSFSGISSIKHLKVIIDTNEEDILKGSRRRLAVLKLLNEESIKWVEGENAGTLLIQLDSINRKKLTFIKK